MIGSGDKLAPSRPLTITWTDVHQGLGRHITSLNRKDLDSELMT